jgi:LysR family transcriptional regulator, glycine cleavage system transcriptional activator
MGTILPLSGLRAFEAAARGRSIRAAAEELNLTSSAVSHAITKLEQELGVTLFQREGRSVKLTPDGDALMRHIGDAFDELRRGIATVSMRLPGLLRLHCAPSFATQWLVPRLNQILALHPGLDIRISAGTDYTRFVNDEFDADIVYGPPVREGLTVIPLSEEIVTPVCAPTLAKRIRAPEDLLDQVLIQSDNKQLRWWNWFTANGIVPPSPRGPRFDRSHLALAAAVNGVGVALESTLLAERELRTRKLVRPLARKAVDVRYVGHHLVFPPAQSRNRALQAFKSWILVELGVARGAETTPSPRKRATVLRR